ncbi:protein fam63a [Nannochloropsis oceanica]
MLLTPRSAASASASPLVFPTKRIPFGPHGRLVPILLQNEAGPCPLLAVANILLLQRQLDVDPEYTKVSLIDILTGIANRVLEATSTAAKAASTADAVAFEAPGGGDEIAKAVGGHADKHVAYQVDEVIHLLPRLRHGMDVNVRFTDVAAFEPTVELSVFDALGIRLFHGWVVGEEDEDEEGREGGVLAQVVGNMTYNQVMEKLVAMKEGGRERRRQKGEMDRGEGKRASSQKLPSLRSSSSISSSSSSSSSSFSSSTSFSLPVSSGATESLSLLEDFLLRTPGQLTLRGLSLLHSTVRENELCGLFHHNHFSVLLKKGGRLYLLVTDEGYKEEAHVVWARLDGVSGAGELVDGLFRPAVEGGGAGGGGGGGVEGRLGGCDHGHAAVGTAMARSLREQEEAEARLIERVMAASLRDVSGQGREVDETGGIREEFKEEMRRNDEEFCLDRVYSEAELAEMRELERDFQYARLQEKESRHGPRGRTEGSQQLVGRRVASRGRGMGERGGKKGKKDTCTLQ